MWLLATFLVVFGAHFSAIWIIMANSWMQTPAGYTITDFRLPAPGLHDQLQRGDLHAIIPPAHPARFGGSWMVGAAVMLGVSAFYHPGKRHLELAKPEFSLALPFFVVFSILQPVRHRRATRWIEVMDYQPVKLAAMEGMWQTRACAPMNLVGWVDVGAEDLPASASPAWLSFLAYGNLTRP